MSSSLSWHHGVGWSPTASQCIPRESLPLPEHRWLPPTRQRTRGKSPGVRVRAAMRDWRAPRGDSEDSSRGMMDPFARRRLENAWAVRQDQVPVACEACQAQGMKECEWCSGSGYFVLGDKLLCEVPSRNTSCLICHGHGTVRCPDCLGTGFRARWLEAVLDKKK